MHHAEIMGKVPQNFGFKYLNMANLPQNCSFRYRGLVRGIDLPLQCELLEFGKNTVKKAWEQKIPAPPFNRLFHLAGGASGEIVMDRRTFPMRTGRMYLIPQQHPFRMRLYPPGAFGFVHFTAMNAEGLDIFREVRTVLPAVLADLPRNLTLEILTALAVPQIYGTICTELRMQYMFVQPSIVVGAGIVSASAELQRIWDPNVQLMTIARAMAHQST